jgi:hypothetical protein
LPDYINLFAAGVKTDDTVCLEFVSPLTPKPLITLRMPAPEKKSKGKGGGKGKGKKKK